MPEKGWYSLTVRLSTARAIKDISKDKKLTVDELLNELISTVQIKKLLTCSLCGVKVKSTNMSSHMAKMHPKWFTTLIRCEFHPKGVFCSVQTWNDFP